MSAESNQLLRLKSEVDSAVKELLALKVSFKAATGNDRSPSVVLPQAPVIASPVPAASPSTDVAALNERVRARGEAVRDLKSKKADKVMIIVDNRDQCSMVLIF